MFLIGIYNVKIVILTIYNKEDGMNKFDQPDNPKDSLTMFMFAFMMVVSVVSPLLLYIIVKKIYSSFF